MKIRLFACYPCHTIFLLTNVAINMRRVTPFPSTVLFHALFDFFLYIYIFSYISEKRIYQKFISKFIFTWINVIDFMTCLLLIEKMDIRGFLNRINKKGIWAAVQKKMMNQRDKEKKVQIYRVLSLQRHQKMYLLKVQNRMSMSKFWWIV